MRDSLSNVQIKTGYGPYYYQGSGVWVTQSIDLQGYESLYFVIGIGALLDADATFVTLMQESDDDTTYTDVADADMVSQTPGTAPETAASFQFDDDGEVRSIGYLGIKRYVKLYITPVRVCSGRPIGGHRKSPVVVGPWIGSVGAHG